MKAAAGEPNDEPDDEDEDEDRPDDADEPNGVAAPTPRDLNRRRHSARRVARRGAQQTPSTR